MASAVAPSLSDSQVAEVLGLIKGSDSVELKLTVPESTVRSTVLDLGLDPIDAQIRLIHFFDTPDLRLYEHGVVVRARRVQRKGDDTIVKLRPCVPSELPASLRKSPGFGVEVDAMPGGFVCSGTLKNELGKARVKETAMGSRPLRKLLSKEQRALYEEHAPDGIGLDDLSLLGPIFVLKLKSSPKGYDRKLVTELWLYPDGSRVLELSTKCKPSEAFDIAAQTRVFLAERGVDLSGEQQAKTRKALEFFSGELRAA